MTLKGRAASDRPSSRPSLQLFLSSLMALGCPHGLGSVSRIQTRRHKRLALNPKRVPLWAPSHGNMTFRTVHPAGTTHLEAGDGVSGQELGSLCSVLALVWGRRPCFVGVLLLARPLPALRREAWGSWRVGVCSGEGGPSRPCWAPNPQALAVVDGGVWGAVLWFTAMGWAGVLWRQPWGPCSVTVSRSKADTMSWRWGPGKAAPVSHCSGWGLISLGKQPA